MTSTSRFADRLRTAVATSTVPRTQLGRRLRKAPTAPAAVPTLEMQSGELFAARLRSAVASQQRRVRAAVRD